MDLWADIENNQQPGLPPAHGGREGVRRPTEGDMLSSLRRWLLQEYVAPYCRSLAVTRIYRRCYWLDALGSVSKANTRHENKQGKNEALPAALEPIVTLARQLAREQPPITLNGLVFTAGSRKKPIKSMAIPVESSLVAAGWLEVASELLKAIEQVPAIFLLNPFGPTVFSREDVRALYQRTAPTELCFLVWHKQLLACLQAARSAEPQGRALTALLHTDRWKTLPQGEEEAQLAVNGCITMFLSMLKRHFPLPVQSLTLPMRTRPALVEEMPCTLIFATRRQDSLFSMNDAVCAYRRQVNEQSYRGLLGEEWFAVQWRDREAAAWRQLYQEILQRGSAQQVRRWPDLRLQAILAHFGQFMVSDYDAIIRELLVKREVRYELKRGGEGDGDMPLPANDDILVWTK